MRLTSTPAEAALPYRSRTCDWNGRGRTKLRFRSAPIAPASAFAFAGGVAFPTAFPAADAKWKRSTTTTAKVATTTAAFSSIGQVAAPLSGHLLAGIGSFSDSNSSFGYHLVRIEY